MPATRLLLIADSKMLSALANGLREGALFDVLTVPLSEPAAAAAAAEKADAVALFYGAPGAPLPAALQRLSPKVRERGKRMVVVLQREQAAQRDECFRAGASDLLFMPMPKEQFVTRLQQSLELSWSPEEKGSPAPVSVATRTAVSRLDQSTVSPAGVESPGELPLKAGETVRLTWGAFQSWGLVVRGGPSAQIRFAGLAPDEEAQIRAWLKNGAPAQSAAAPTPPGGSAAVSAPAATARAEPTPPGGSAAVSAPQAAPRVAGASPGGSAGVSSSQAAARAAPAIGPPPGFADRRPVRAQTRAPVRIAPPVMTGAGAAVSRPPAEAAAEPASLPAAIATPYEPAGSPPAGTNGDAMRSASFEEAAAPGSAGTPPAFDFAAAAPKAPEPAGPIWPTPFTVGASKAVTQQLLKDKTVPAEVPPALVAAAKKLTFMLGSAERAALDKGPDSHFADALATRIALDAATAEGVKLYSSSPPATVDAGAVAALMKQADEATARLQKEANSAVGKGEVESLQMVTAASAALSRDLLHFRETADRLRGQSAAPRLGAGALDPDLVAPGHAPRPSPAKSSTAPAAVRAELRDFHNLDGGPGRGKTILMVIALAAFIVALANAVYFSQPHQKELSTEAAGRGVERIDTAGTSALVTVSPEWLGRADAALPQLVSVLREAEVKNAVLLLPNGNAAGLVDVTTGKVSGLATAKAAGPPR